MNYTLDTHPDAPALLEALERQDDSVLPILADLLEECGDARAVGLRDILTWEVEPKPQLTKETNLWYWQQKTWNPPQDSPHHLGRPLMDKLPGVRWFGHRFKAYRIRAARFLSRADAFLALAEALVQCRKG